MLSNKFIGKCKFTEFDNMSSIIQHENHLKISNDSLYNKKCVCKQIFQDWNKLLLFYMICFFFGSSAQLRLLIDYESKYTFPLTNDSVRQICAVNTTFAGISCGYGIFPPKDIRNSMDNISIEDWGVNKYNIKDSSIRKYFK
jgi:hypothetical protein